jgi:hypothetical protein
VLGSIHEQLESFDNWTTIDFSRHLREICAALMILFEERAQSASTPNRSCATSRQRYPWV